MLKREAIRSVNYLMHRGAINAARMSFVLNSVNDVSVIERDGRHNDTIYYPKDVTLYFDIKGHEITRKRFERLQELADAAEAFLHSQPLRPNGGLVMKKHENFDEIKKIFSIGDDNTAKYRAYYKNTFSRDTKLSDDDIINMVAGAEDDNDPSGWAQSMLAIELENAPTTA